MRLLVLAVAIILITIAPARRHVQARYGLTAVVMLLMFVGPAMEWLSDRFRRAAAGLRLQRALAVCTVGWLVAVPLGTVIGYSRPLYHVSEPTLEFLRPAPAIAIMPIAFLFFGLDVRMKVFVIAWGAFWPILLNAVDGVRSIDSILFETARIYGYRGRGMLGRIVLPAALPYTMAGLRLGLTISLILAIFVEIFTSGSGLGFLIVEYRAAIRIPEVYASILMVALLGYLLNAGFVAVEDRVIRWYRQSHETG